MALQNTFINQRKEDLLKEKVKIMNRLQMNRQNFSLVDKRGGDEADQTVTLRQEQDAVLERERLKHRLVEIENALARIEDGSYGICDETEEPIEAKRLMAIPWTSLSIEGAQMRENLKRQYAR